MSILDEQLERWKGYEEAAIEGAKNTHNHIRDNLEATGSRLNDRDITFDTILQGSYANDTIIRESSDVDILVRMQEPFYADKNELSESEVDNFYQLGHYQKNSEYGYDDFRADVAEELRENYGADAVTDGNKAIELESSTLPISADVVPCEEYRYYNQYTGYDNDRDYIEGIIFWTSSGTKIRNYPEQHMQNGTKKHQNTDNRFKPTVRMFKNSRNKMVEEGIISSKDLAPSYFIECLVWNADNDIIDQPDLQLRYLGVVKNLLEKDFNDFRHQHDLLDLFGRGISKWSESNARMFLNGLDTLWDSW